MRLIAYYKLYNYFVDKEALSSNAALRNIWRVRNLPVDFKAVVSKILDNDFATVADFSVEGVTLRQLLEEENMKPLQAVFFLDWLRREPANACSFMASGRLRGIDHELSDDERSHLSEALNRCKEMLGKDTPSVLVPEDNSGKDIDIDEIGSNMGVMAPDIECHHSDAHDEEQVAGDISSQQENDSQD